MPKQGRHDLQGLAQECLTAAAPRRTPGWQPYQVLTESSHRQAPGIAGSGKNAVKLFPWVHPQIAKGKGNSRGVYHGSGKNLFPVTWPSFATVTTDDSGKSRCLTG